MGKQPGFFQRIKDWFNKKPRVNLNDPRWRIYNDPNLITPKTIRDLINKDQRIPDLDQFDPSIFMSQYK